MCRPDPASVAPAIDPSIPTDLFTATRFLYSGSSPIQTGVAANAIDPARAALLRGRVLQRDGTAAPGVTVSVHGHAELGQTLSRADGAFDLVVNGGGPVLLGFTQAGFLPVQRRVDTAWQTSVAVDDVVVLPPDPKLTAIDLAATQAVQVARGTRVVDADGARQATLLFAPGTTATMRLPDGTSRSLSSMGVRATEYTVGNSGPNAMPGDLPPASAYTYALDLTVDEALAAGATEVRFGTPVPFYVENFLDFPVGTIVPLGAYDRGAGTWVPLDSGRVLKILGVTNGLAVLDSDGDGQPDSSATLASLGVTDAERQQLAITYTSGQTLWRVQLPHFSSFDLNFGIGPPPGARPPGRNPRRDQLLPGTCRSAGSSSIECQNQVLSERLPLVGSPFELVYQSERVPGRTAAYSVEIPLSDDQLPNGVRSIQLEVRVAGQVIRQSFQPQQSLTTTFTWNGRDAYGRTLMGSQPVTIRTGYTYGAVYGGPVRFGDPGTGRVTGVIARQEVTLWHVWQSTVGTLDARTVGLGGWMLNVQHVYDPAERVLYRGDGTREPVGGFIADSAASSIGTFAGIGTIDGRQLDGVPAVQQPIDPQGIAAAADGSVYLADGLLLDIRKVTRDGIITTVAGNRTHCSSPTDQCGDGGPALQAPMDGASAIAVGPDGSVYFWRGHRPHPSNCVRRHDLDSRGDWGKRLQWRRRPGHVGPVRTRAPEGLAVGRDNTLYIADTFNRRIRRVGPDGIITTFAGDGTTCASGPVACGDNGPATAAQLAFPEGVAVASDGSVYIADPVGRIRVVTPDGTIHTAAGTGANGFSGDAGPATQAVFNNPSAVAVGPDDSVYVIDQLNNRVRWFQPGGSIFTLAGTGISGTFGDGGPAPPGRPAGRRLRPDSRT